MMRLSEILFRETSYNLTRQQPEDIEDPNIMNMGNERGIYCTGLCGEFAAALSEMFGYRLGAIKQLKWDSDHEEEYTILVHAFARHPSDNSLGIDAVGIRSVDEMMEDSFVSGEGKLVVQDTSRVELDEQSMEGLDGDAMKDAKVYIDVHRDRYEV